MNSFAEKLKLHVETHPAEINRCMSGFVAAFPTCSVPEIRTALDQMVAEGILIRYGNGKRHCWKTVGAPKSEAQKVDEFEEEFFCR